MNKHDVHNQSQSTIAKRFVPFISNLIVIQGALLLLTYNPYFHNAFRIETQITLVSLALIYALGGAVYYALIPTSRLKTTEGYEILYLLRRLAVTTFGNRVGASSCSRLSLTNKEKTVILFYVVKFIFLPLMINFTVLNWDLVNRSIGLLANGDHNFTLGYFNNVIFPALLAGILFVDTLYFVFGYLLESSLPH